MQEIYNQILNINDAATLPNLVESGNLPALISGLSPIHRVNLAAAIADKRKEPLVVICADESTAESFAADLSIMLGEETKILGMREFALCETEAASHSAEQKRLSTLYAMANESCRLYVVSVQGLVQKTISKKTLFEKFFVIENPGSYSMDSIMEALINCGYSRAYQVEGVGQFSQRGGILDFFSPFENNPIRIEFWGDDIDSMAYFDVSSQRRIEEINKCTIILTTETDIEEVTAKDYFPDNSIVFIDQPKRCSDKFEEYSKTVEKSFLVPFKKLMLEEYPLYMAEAFVVGSQPIEPKTLMSMQAKQLPSYAGNAEIAVEDTKQLLSNGYSVALLAADDRRAKMTSEYLREHGVHNSISTGNVLPQAGECLVYTGSISAGFEYPEIKFAVLTDAQLIKKKENAYKRKLPSNRVRIESYSDLSIGDYVVHEAHGIGKFAGISKIEVEGYYKDYIKINFAGTDVVYVPVTQLDVITKYSGLGDEEKVKLSKLGGTDWEKKRSRAKHAAKDMAKKLISLYAARMQTSGFAFDTDNEWQKEFEDNFAYTETDDQIRCIEEIKKDMEASVPMDRVLCGDVGFGKTEVAFRAAMKCILNGKQVALLAPTTVLAQQHFQTAKQRFFGFPITIGVLSRFTAGASTNNTLMDIVSGKCDLAIGTHRLLSKDVKFKNLGLLIVDEEQRFGVTHKEHIKELAKGVDILTLSATPIPRTMNMALSGIRDMSIIEEPPQDRQPVQTFVIEHNWDTLKEAMQRELIRGGQVYYLHNRIDDIEKTAIKIQDLLENATVGVAHGRMEKRELSEVMDKVVNGEIQILVCTTIIETGIDIPNVNTLIIEDADRLGLAQLHQIRGRVGRSSRKASAYLTFRRDKIITEDAEKRLNAIRDFVEFGSGFKIALKDLEIRGAGTLLGAEQSGHMTDVGYDMYMKLLNEAVLEAKGIEIPKKAECSADLAITAGIPESYVEQSEIRMDIYRKIALVRSEEEAQDLTDELIDRFGDIPPSVNSLIQVALLRGEAGNVGITDIAQKNGEIRFSLEEIDMSKVLELGNSELYKRRLRIDNGLKPCLALKLSNKTRALEEAKQFVQDWAKIIEAQVPINTTDKKVQKEKE